MRVTALDGLSISRRCDNFALSVALNLMQEKRMSANDIRTLLHFVCGLFRVPGPSDDMRIL